MGKNVVEVILKARDATGNVLQKFQRNFRAVKRVVMDVTRVVVASTAAVGALILGLTKLGERGSKVIAVKRTFAKITGDETAALNKLREAARGTVDDFRLMASHNQALALGAADTTEAFAEMVNISRILGRAQGIEAAEALDKFTVGLARQSILRLDDLGITISTAEANERYAKTLGKSSAALTEAERTMAFRNETFRQARDLVAELSTGEAGGTEATNRFSTAISNLRDSFAVMVAESPEVAAFFDSFTTVIEDLADIVATGDIDMLKRVFTQLGTIAGNAFSLAMKEAVSGARGFVGSMVEAFTPEMDENQSKALDDAKGARGIFGIGGGDRRGPLEMLLDKMEGSLDESAELAKENIEVARAALAEIAAEARARAAAAASAGGGPSGPGAAPAVNVPGVAFRGASVDGPRIAALSPAAGSRARLRPIVGNENWRIRAQRIAGAVGGGGDLSEATDEFAQAGQVVAASMFGMAQAAVRGSDQVASSVVSMITQIAQSLPGVGGIFGTIIGGVGGLIGAALSRNRDPVPVRIRDIDDAAAKKWQANGQPIRITTVTEVGGVEVERIERELIDRQNRDEVVRYNRGAAV